LRSQLVVGVIEVGRVSVAVIIYEIVPRSNWTIGLAAKQQEPARSTYVYAARQPLGGEKEVKIELISPRLQSSVRAEYLLILK
jgi:hypothetical protein